MSRVRVRGIVAGVAGIIFGILLIVTLLGIGWYYWYFDISAEDETVEMDFEYGLSSSRMEMKVGGYSRSAVADNEDGADTNTKDVFDIVYLSVLFGIIVAFAFGVLAILAGIRLVPGWIPFLLGIASAILVIIAPIYMMSALPGAMKNDWNKSMDEGMDQGMDEWVPSLIDRGPKDSFWGSDSTDTEVDTGFSQEDVHIDYSWGPYWCWYMTMVIGIMLFIGAVMCIGIKKKPFDLYRYDYPPPVAYEKLSPHPREGSAPVRKGSSCEDEYESLYGPQKRDTYEDVNVNVNEPYEAYFNVDGSDDHALSQEDSYFAEVIMMDPEDDERAEVEAIEVEPYEE